jgi:hypothetical protein
MMVLDHVGDQEAMVYAQLGHQPLARTTETSLERSSGTLSCCGVPSEIRYVTVFYNKVSMVFDAGTVLTHRDRLPVSI